MSNLNRNISCVFQNMSHLFKKSRFIDPIQNTRKTKQRVILFICLNLLRGALMFLLQHFRKVLVAKCGNFVNTLKY